MEGIGRLLIISGAVMALVGVVFVLAPQIPFLGRLPAIDIQTDQLRIVIPVGAMLLVSVVLTIVLNVIGRR